ncbi:Uncharacterised protein [Mycobacteroides abscessus subsp. massiliense]|nr:Uncharacterised protein [Mycobacteroides abscessus subsp. massiliense]
MPLLLGMEVAIDLSERVVGRGDAQRAHHPSANVLDPHQIRHELFEIVELLGVDGVGTRLVPVEVRQCPLPGFDLAEDVLKEFVVLGDVLGVVSGQLIWEHGGHWATPNFAELTESSSCWVTIL